MGFVLVGIGAVDALGISGAMLQMVSHGLIAAAMFFVTGVFYERTKTLSIPTSTKPMWLTELQAILRFTLSWAKALRAP